MRRFEFTATIQAARLVEFEQWCEQYKVKLWLDVTRRSPKWEVLEKTYRVRFRNESSRLLFKLTWGGADVRVV